MHITAMTVKETLSINYQNLGKKPNWQKQPVGHLQSKIDLKYEQWEILQVVRVEFCTQNHDSLTIELRHHLLIS